MVATRVRGAPPASWPTQASSHVGSASQNSHIIQKKSPSIFIPFGLRLIWIFCKTKNMQQTGTGTWHCINMLVSKNSIKTCQKFIKVVEYWHGTIKNYSTTETYQTRSSIFLGRAVFHLGYIYPSPSSDFIYLARPHSLARALKT